MQYYVQSSNRWVDSDDTEVIQQMVTYTVKDKPITVSALTRVYKVTEEPVFDDDLDDQLLKKLYRKYDQLCGKDDGGNEEAEH